MENVSLKLLTKLDEEKFIKENHEAFNYGALQYFSSIDDQVEEEGQIISHKTIYDSIHKENAFAYRIFLGTKKVGGIIVNVDGDKGDLDILFINPEYHGNGIGSKAWFEIEKKYPNVKKWETFTPTFEKRNINFYVNKLGFHIVEYFNKYHPDFSENDELDEMYRFEKIIK